jgi:hypothetical protein
MFSTFQLLVEHPYHMADANQSNATFSTKSQIPQGQAPAQNPQPIQRSLLTWYSKVPDGVSVREMAFSGQVATQMPQSRH